MFGLDECVSVCKSLLQRNSLKLWRCTFATAGVQSGQQFYPEPNLLHTVHVKGDVMDIEVCSMEQHVICTSRVLQGACVWRDSDRTYPNVVVHGIHIKPET